MYLPIELDPMDTPQYAVVRPIRSTGAREITTITSMRDAAKESAREIGGYVIELRTIADFR